MAAVITRTGKGAAITQSENDSNLDSLCGINEPQTGTTYTVVAADQNSTIEFSNASPVVATLTLISTIIAANDTSDFQVLLKNIGAGIVTVTPTTDTFDDGSATKTLAQYEWITIQTDSTQALWNVVASSDASKVDGLDASQFLRSDENDTATGDLIFNGSNTYNGVDVHTTSSNFTGVISIDSVVITSTATELNVLDGVIASTAEINYNDITTLGTVEASKTVTADASKNIIDVNDLTVDGVINTDTIAATTSITTATTSTDTVTAKTTNGDLDLVRNGTGEITVDTVPIYGLVVLDTPERVVNNSITEGSWSTVNSSTLDTANAVKAILRFVVNCSGNSVRAEMDSYVRKTGSGLAVGELNTVVSVENSGNFVTGRAAAQATVNLDSNSDFDWYSNSTSGTPVTSVILVGYYV